jgi:hypothetical protein
MEVDERLTDTNYPLDSPLSEDKIIGKYFKYTQTVDGDSAVITYKFLSSMGEGVYMMTFAKEAHVLSQYKDVVADIDGDFLFLEDGTKITKDAFLALLDYNTFKDSLEASGMDIKPEWTERIDTPFGPRKVSVLSGQGGTETCTVYHVGDRIYRSVDAQNGSFGSLALTIEVLSSSLLQ